MTIDLASLTCSFETPDRGRSNAVEDVSLSLRQGEFFTLLGPSGCGKTTTLRCIAGLETPDGGSITINDVKVFDADRKVNVPTNRRDIAMVFQSYAIWPHMTVFENVAFPLGEKRKARSSRRAEVLEALRLVGLEAYAHRSATQLSGGQQQRVALARASVRKASVMLLDEPLSNLDAELRIRMRSELRDLQRRLGLTFVYVTHDQDEALGMSDRIAVMDAGRIVEVGTPEEVYFRPKKAFTARFVGSTVSLSSGDLRSNGAGSRFDTELGELRSTDAVPDQECAGAVIRPEHIEMSAAEVDPATGENVVSGTVTAVEFTGQVRTYAVETEDGFEFIVRSLSGLALRKGSRVVCYFPPERVRLLEG